MQHQEPQNEGEKVAAAIKQVELLMGKQLYAQAKRILEKAKATALYYEQFSALLDLLRLEITLMCHTQEVVLQEKLGAELFEQMNECSRKLAVTVRYRALFYWMHTHVRQSGMRYTVADRESLAHILQLPELQSPEQAITHSALKHFYEIHLYSCLINKDSQGGFYYAHLHWQLCEQQAHLFLKHPAERARILYNYLTACLRAGEWAAFDQHISAFKTIQYATPMEATVIFIGYYNLLLDKHLQNFEWSELAATVQNMENELQKYEFNLVDAQRATLYLQVAYSLHLLHRFNKSLGWLQKVKAMNEKNMRSGLLVVLHIQELLLHYDLDHVRLLEYRIRAVRRQLLVREWLQPTEKAVLQFLDKAIRLPDTSEKRQLYQDFRKTLLELQQQELLGLWVSVFDLLAWINAKIYNQSFATALENASTL